ncbi:MAG TPA: hypothetical protein PJ986_05490 [Gammaproteobacteria bacterium]|nr:hypothetical protein [Gammaproteobacteria bacterium]
MNEEVMLPRMENPASHGGAPTSFPRILRLLLLCDFRPDGAQTVLDHINAVAEHSGHEVSVLSILGDLPRTIDLERFDGVILHYSLIISNDEYLDPDSRARLRRFSGLKAVFIQDEYRFVDKTCEALRYLGVQLLFTCVPESEWEKVYPDERIPGMRKINVLTGYVPHGLVGRTRRDYRQRRLDVGYRGRRLPAHYGELAQDKWRIAERFSADAARFGLVCDISCQEHRRLYGEKWNEFLQGCKAVLGVESGASVFDFQGDIEEKVITFERRNPGASFEQIREHCFSGLDGLIKLNQISPRCFEAAALGTLMILYEGEYSGVLKPGRHYVALKKDHSNMSEVVAILRNERKWNEITGAAYKEIALNPLFGYRHFGTVVGAAISDAFALIDAALGVRNYYSDEAFAEATIEHRRRLASRQADRARFATLRWRLIAKFVATSPPWITAPLRLVWRTWRRYQSKNLT